MLQKYIRKSTPKVYIFKGDLEIYMEKLILNDFGIPYVDFNWISIHTIEYERSVGDKIVNPVTKIRNTQRPTANAQRPTPNAQRSHNNDQIII